MQIDQDTYFKLKKERTALRRKVANYERLFQAEQGFSKVEITCETQLSEVRTNYKELRADIKQFLGADKYRNFLIMRGE